MAEVVRSVVSRFRRYLGERRSPRVCVRLLFALSLQGVTANGGRPVLEGHTRDLSATGLALIVHVIQIGGHHLVAQKLPLSLVLELPSGPVQISAIPVRYEQLDAMDPDTGYLIGARIEEMTDEDRRRYVEYVRSRL